MINNFQYNYLCPITSQSTSITGGCIIKPHRSSSGSNCRPNYVFSVGGFINFLNNPPCKCINNCGKTNLTQDDFQEIEPQEDPAVAEAARRAAEEAARRSAEEAARRAAAERRAAEEAARRAAAERRAAEEAARRAAEEAARRAAAERRAADEAARRAAAERRAAEEAIRRAAERQAEQEAEQEQEAIRLSLEEERLRQERISQERKIQEQEEKLRQERLRIGNKLRHTRIGTTHYNISALNQSSLKMVVDELKSKSKNIYDNDIVMKFFNMNNFEAYTSGIFNTVTPIKSTDIINIKGAEPNIIQKINEELKLSVPIQTQSGPTSGSVLSSKSSLSAQTISAKASEVVSNIAKSSTSNLEGSLLQEVKSMKIEDVSSIVTTIMSSKPKKAGLDVSEYDLGTKKALIEKSIGETSKEFVVTTLAKISEDVGKDIPNRYIKPIVDLQQNILNTGSSASDSKLRLDSILKLEKIYEILES